MIKAIKNDQIYEMDQFFTRPEIALQCVRMVVDLFVLDEFKYIIEPSAGTGAFYNLLPSDRRVGIELDRALCQNNPEFINTSFFDYLPDRGNILVVGNPPFGTQNNLSIDFFNHSARFAEVIAFIIPKTWKKPSIQNRLSLDFELIRSTDLPADSFVGNKPTNVKCCFQIWKRLVEPRKKMILSKIHTHWIFLPYIKDRYDLYPPKEADFVILAYGSNSGQISRDLFKWRPKSVHFIKSNIDTDVLIKRLESLNYNSANDSARQSSLGRGELVELYANSLESKVNND